MFHLRSALRQMPRFARDRRRGLCRYLSLNKKMMRTRRRLPFRLEERTYVFWSIFEIPELMFLQRALAPPLPPAPVMAPPVAPSPPARPTSMAGTSSFRPAARDTAFTPPSLASSAAARPMSFAAPAATPPPMSPAMPMMNGGGETLTRCMLESVRLITEN